MGKDESNILYENQRYYGPMGWCGPYQAASTMTPKHDIGFLLSNAAADRRNMLEQRQYCYSAGKHQLCWSGRSGVQLMGIQ